MTIEKIKNKIKSDAENQSKKLIDQAKKDAAKTDDENKKSVKEYEKKHLTEIQAEVKLFKDKTLAQARLKAKRKFLDKRESVIRENIDSAIAKWDHKSKDYTDFLNRTLDQNISLLTGDITVYCNKKDLENIRQSCSEKAEVKESDIIAGVIIEDSAGKRIDESIDSRLERKKNMIRQKIIQSIGA